MGDDCPDGLIDDVGVFLEQVRPLVVVRERCPFFGGQGGRVRGIGDDAQLHRDQRIGMSAPPFPRYLTGKPAVRKLLRIASSVDFGWPIGDFRGGRVAADALDAVDDLERAVDFADELVRAQRVDEL